MAPKWTKISEIPKTETDGAATGAATDVPSLPKIVFRLKAFADARRAEQSASLARMARAAGDLE